MTAFATPVLPPLAFAQAKAGRLVAGGAGGETGGCSIRGADATGAGDGPELTVAAGARVGPQAATSMLRHRMRAVRMSQLVWSRLLSRAPRWRNRQTRRSQKPMSARTFGFDSRSRHLKI